MRNRNRWSLFRENRRRVLSVVISNFIANIPRGMFQGLLYFVIIQLTLPFIDGTRCDYSVLWHLYWWYVVAFIAFMLLSIWSQTNTFWQAYSISTDLRLMLGEKLRRLPLGYFKRHDPGDVTSRMLHDVNKAETTLSHSLADIATSMILPMMLGIFLAVVNPFLASIMVAAVLASSVFFLIARTIVGSIGVLHIEAITETSSRILEFARCIKLLKAYDMAGEAFESLDVAMLRLKRRSFQTEVFAGIPVQLFLLTLDAGYFVMLAVAVYMCSSGALAIPELFSFIVLGYYCFAPIKQLGMLMVALRHSAISSMRIGEVLDSPELPYRKETELPIENSISFKEVHFRYGQEDVLNGVCCQFPERSMTALVGLSGSGKTTISSLVARFWDVQEGAVFIGDVPLKDLSPDKLLSRMAFVFQDVYLFNDTIADNIRVGKQDATIEEVHAAARLACCHDFIVTLPNGYETIVSEAGGSLSGGERQRISIARAILKNAAIVVLDEATASLDPENEAEIQRAIENLVHDKTVIVIAHRFKSIENADQILVLDNGKIVAKGTHDTLVKSHGLYQRLWETQQKAGTWKIRTA